MKVPQYKKMNWVLYMEQYNQKKKTEYDAILDKVFEIATPLCKLYQTDNLSVYCSESNVHVEYVCKGRHLFINQLPIQYIKKLGTKECAFILNRLIKGLNQSKKILNEK